ncbi:hypothetical protein GCM10009639_35130 [Kitasatospora putterlickiae]|uniref:Uncharacterized protein n=1 Tax=Kitasatospora putterlickiae TaxID=221725 RepID=A0ABN1Y4A9_9ACTN
MTSDDVLATLRAHWDEIWELLDEPSRDRLRALAEDTTGDPERIARRIVRLVRATLPDGHPVRELFDDSTRFVRDRDGADVVVNGPASGSAALVASVADLLRPTPAPAGPTPPDDADDWLLAADSVTATAYRAGGHDPADPGLIRLTDPQGTVRLPSFQFDDASGRPLPVVVAVNRLLDAADDPWGVADWWLGANAWLDAVPARLLGTTGEHTLLAAARAEIAEW